MSTEEIDKEYGLCTACHGEGVIDDGSHVYLVYGPTCGTCKGTGKKQV